jgi:hypothetical protein
MKTSLLLGILLPTLLITTSAIADDRAACLTAATKGQRFKDTHKLVEAREQLRVCAAAQCPAVVQTDCAAWLAEVEKALPGVVITAKNGSGVDLVEVKVSVDGTPLLTKLDGTSTSMNPGPHQFHFEAADGTLLDQQVVVREGEKNQTVAVVLGAPPPAAVKVSPPGVETPIAPATTSSTWKTAGWILGGVGVAGLGVGTIFGIIATGDKSSAHCDSNNVCDPGTVSGIKSAALISDIGWISGGVLLAGGAALVLWGPRKSEGTAAALRLAPMFTANGGGIVAGGAW